MDDDGIICPQGNFLFQLLQLGTTFSCEAGGFLSLMSFGLFFHVLLDRGDVFKGSICH